MESNKIKFLKKFNNLFISIKMTIFKKISIFLSMALSLCLGIFYWKIINLLFLNIGNRKILFKEKNYFKFIIF